MDAVDIEKHLVIFDDLSGHCPGCKKTGIKYEQITECPECGRSFKYITFRDNPQTQKGLLVLNKIIKHFPGLAIINYDDYKHEIDKLKVKDLFGSAK